jgi:hypothetical protein
MPQRTSAAQRPGGPDASIGHGRALVLATLLATVMRFGAFWDVQWHFAVGRDSFTIPPHLMLYSGVALIGLLSLAMAWRSSVRRGHMSPLFWSWITQLFGVALLVSAAPFDDMWHRWYGIDITIWSPPHLVGVLGAVVVDLGIFAGWALLWQVGADPRRTRRAIRGLIWATALVVSMLNFALIPAMRWSVLQPAAPVLYVALGSLFIPGVLIALGWITGRMWPVLLVLGVLVFFRLVDQQVWNWGLRVVVPAWDQTVRRTDVSWFEWHMWLHVIVNALVILTVWLFAASWRIRRRASGAILAGLAAGGVIYGGVWALGSGLVTRTLPFSDTGTTGQEFHTETDWLLGLMQTVAIAPWGWALIGGAISGLAGYTLVKLIRRAGRVPLLEPFDDARGGDARRTRRVAPVQRA